VPVEAVGADAFAEEEDAVPFSTAVSWSCAAVRLA
jgi:hypothetical protein